MSLFGDIGIDTLTLQIGNIGIKRVNMDFDCYFCLYENSDNMKSFVTGITVKLKIMFNEVKYDKIL